MYSRLPADKSRWLHFALRRRPRQWRPPTHPPTPLSPRFNNNASQFFTQLTIFDLVGHKFDYFFKWRTGYCTRTCINGPYSTIHTTVHLTALDFANCEIILFLVSMGMFLHSTMGGPVFDFHFWPVHWHDADHDPLHHYDSMLYEYFYTCIIYVHAEKIRFRNRPIINGHNAFYLYIFIIWNLDFAPYFCRAKYFFVIFVYNYVWNAVC